MTVTIARWQRVKEIFNDVVDLSGGDRGHALSKLCGDDADLHRDVESLLSADDRALRCIPPAAMPQSVGPFRIIRQIGRGAATVVYLGVRDGSLTPPVAIKVVTTRLAGQTMEPSRAEREILPRLDHPNLAGFLDAGTTSDGLPYLVTEYVDGIAMDRYCAERHLPLRANLEIFLGICSAVELAHQHEVIHGDINSRNILVTRAGVPKLLDLAPAYASPRRMAGLAPTTKSDIYALGVVLSEILTNDDGYQAALLVDTIVRTALRKGGSAGYPTVQALSEDLRRYLGSQLTLLRDGIENV